MVPVGKITNTGDPSHMTSMRPGLDGTWEEAEVTPLNLLLEYEVNQSHCYDPNEENR